MWREENVRKAWRMWRRRTAINGNVISNNEMSEMANGGVIYQAKTGGGMQAAARLALKTAQLHGSSAGAAWRIMVWLRLDQPAGCIMAWRLAGQRGWLKQWQYSAGGGYLKIQ